MNSQQQNELHEIGRLPTYMTEEENPQQFQQFLNDLRSGQVKAVCDGSFFPTSQIGTAARILEYPNSSYSRWGRICTPGEKHIQNTYCSELMDITSLMTEITHISKVYSVDAAISIGCDNKGAVDKLNRLTNMSNEILLLLDQMASR